MASATQADQEHRLLEATVDELKHLFSPRAETGETVLLNMGPQHPSTHGVLRVMAELDGEIIVNAIPDIGYLHTGIEKNMEAKTYLKALVMSDRIDYLNTIGNNFVYCLAIEKLMDVQVPPRAQALRVILAELQRIASHLVWLGTHSADIASQSVLFYCFREREKIMAIHALISGHHLRYCARARRTGSRTSKAPARERLADWRSPQRVGRSAGSRTAQESAPARRPCSTGT